MFWHGDACVVGGFVLAYCLVVYCIFRFFSRGSGNKVLENLCILSCDIFFVHKNRLFFHTLVTVDCIVWKSLPLLCASLVLITCCLWKTFVLSTIERRQNQGAVIHRGSENESRVVAKCTGRN